MKTFEQLTSARGDARQEELLIPIPYQNSINDESIFLCDECLVAFTKAERMHMQHQEVCDVLNAKPTI